LFSNVAIVHHFLSEIGNLIKFFFSEKFENALELFFVDVGYGNGRVETGFFSKISPRVIFNLLNPNIPYPFIVQILPYLA